MLLCFFVIQFILSIIIIYYHNINTNNYYLLVSYFWTYLLLCLKGISVSMWWHWLKLKNQIQANNKTIPNPSEEIVMDLKQFWLTL